MTNQELLQDLNRRHERLEVALTALKDDLFDLRHRFETQGSASVPPPLPVVVPPRVEPVALPPLPQIPAFVSPTAPFPETSETAPDPVATETRVEAQTDSPGFELQFGRWLARIGVVFALFTVIFFSVFVGKNYYHYLGPWSKLSVLTLVSTGLIAGGLRMEKRDPKLVVYGRTLAGGGLACLYYTIYGASYVPQLYVNHSPLLGGFLLLAWSVGVLTLAQNRKSELLSIFAISLAYFSSAITPGNGFVMTADLILALTAVIFLLRNAWTGLSYLCLIGTYAGFLRQAVIDRGLLDFQWTGHLPFWPSAVYLTGAWLIFTAGILLSRTPEFAAGKRMAFLCLNNGAWVGLLIVAAWLGGYNHLGGIFETTGGVLLLTCAAARVLHPDSRDLTGAYLAQGLAFATGGIAVAYSGVTRGLLITIESVFLVASGAFSRNIILRIGGIISALVGAGFLAAEIGLRDQYVWVLTFGGALAMLANAWLARKELWSEPREIANARFVISSAFFAILSLLLLVTGIVFHAPDNWMGPDLAFVTLALTAIVYFIPIFELPIPAQALLVFGQFLSYASAFFVPPSAHPPHWSLNLVALVTIILSTWWPRQKLVRTGGWFTPLSAIYALAMVAYCYDSIQPGVTAQSWMMLSAILSLVFLAYGALGRLPAFVVMGQLLLALSVFTFLNPDHDYVFAWSGWAAAVPIAVVFGTGWIVREWLPGFFGAETSSRGLLQILARVYQSMATGLLVRWVFGVVPSSEINFALFVLATAFVLGGLRGRSSYGVRTGFVLAVAGSAHYFVNSVDVARVPFAWLDAGAFALFLAQPAMLRKWGNGLVSFEESWAVIMGSAAMAWLFVSNSINADVPQNLTLGWALFALALTVIGFVANERRQRWCGLAILVAAFVRVAMHDFWLFSDLDKVITFLVLSVICLGLSFLYFKFADRLKEWL